MTTGVKLSVLFCALVAAFGALQSTWAAAPSFATLHNFTSGNDATPAYPYGGVVASGGIFYATAFDGGNSGEGTVYAVGPDGVSILHHFSAVSGPASTNSDGAVPVAGLALSGNTLFGTTLEGGASGNGTVFAINTDGTGFTNLYSFTAISNNTNADGANPIATLAVSGATLYGTAQNGGRFGLGTVFKLSTNGSGFSTLFSFGRGQTGLNPVSGVIVSGSLLYGTTVSGGAHSMGSVYSLSTAGNVFNTVYSFTGGNDGANPIGGVILSGSTLWGTASEGGTYMYGTVFGVQTDGVGITNPYEFMGGTDGANPSAGVVLSGDTLYGTTTNSESGYGTVFEVNTDTTGFASYEFMGNGSDGSDPNAAVILAGGVLYGTCVNGTEPDNATLYEVDPTGMTLSLVNTYSGGNDGDLADNDGDLSESSLVSSGGIFYGATTGGGGGFGTLFKFNADGTGYTNFHLFAGFPDGAFPEGPLLLSGGTLYGTAATGGSGGWGTVFSVSTNGTALSPLHSFDSADGRAPTGALARSGNTLFGTTASAGTTTNDLTGTGTIYGVDAGTMVFTNLHTFSELSVNGSTNGDGATPQGGLILSGTTLYGTAYDGGTGSSGTIYAVQTNGMGFTNLHSFTLTTLFNTFNTNRDGAHPTAPPVLSGSVLFGTTLMGGTAGVGTVYAMSTNGLVFTNLYTFTNGADGANPEGALILSGGTLYGTTMHAGTFGEGTVFSISTNGTGFTILYTFSGLIDLFNNDDGASPGASLALFGNTLYGTATQGGYWGEGTTFTLALNTISSPVLSIAHSGTNVILSWPDTATGFTLQSTANLLPPAWTTVTNTPVIVNSQYTVTNAISTISRFYRLIQ
jgi:uncharacterized repeat protein (TIGR03803 family)